MPPFGNHPGATKETACSSISLDGSSFHPLITRTHAPASQPHHTHTHTQTHAHMARRDMVEPTPPLLSECSTLPPRGGGAQQTESAAGRVPGKLYMTGGCQNGDGSIPNLRTDCDQVLTA